MTEAPTSAPVARRRFLASGRLWSTGIENLPVEARVQQIDEEIAQLAPRLARRMRWSVIVLLLASGLSSIASVVWPVVDVIPHVAIVVVALTVFPTILDAWERFQHNTEHGRYHAWTERQTRRLGGSIRRRRLGKTFAQYGRQEISAALGLEDSAWYSLAAQGRRVRNRKIVAASVVVVCLAGYGIDVTAFSHQDLKKTVGQEFPLGNLYKLTVTGNATCTMGQPNQDATCTVPITVLNATNDPQTFSELDIGPVKSSGPYYWIPDPEQSNQDPVDFATSLVGPTGHHYYFDMFWPSENKLQPGQSAFDVFTYTWAYGAKITELVFDAADDSRITIRVSIGTT